MNGILEKIKNYLSKKLEKYPIQNWLIASTSEEFKAAIINISILYSFCVIYTVYLHHI